MTNNKIWIGIGVIALLSGLAFWLTKSRQTGISQIVKGDKAIILDLWIDEVPSLRGDLFESGADTDLIVRNRPHGKLKIQSAQCVPLSTDRFYLRRVSIPTQKAPPEAMPFREPFLWQCRLTLLDPEALSTANGYLSHGNQLKIGNNIALEGPAYRVDGFIVDIRPQQ
ncbi:MAG: DUF4330 family protein [Candidatus Caenarcaniphilales bacterium]|nr:DUF4330 family protein [Candidatus Caenarcaniphilales bacterium]